MVAVLCTQEDDSSIYFQFSEDEYLLILVSLDESD